MKKIFIILFIFIELSALSQVSISIDSIQVSDINGTDTSLYHTFYSKTPYLVLFDFTNLDCNNSMLIVKNLVVIDDLLYRKFDRNIYPIVLDKTNIQFREIDNNDTMYIYSLKGDHWPGEYLMYKWIKGGCTNGSLKKIIVR